MVCDNMEVETKRIRGPYQTDEAINISIEGYDSLFVIKSGTRCEPGTRTVLELRSVHPWQRMTKSEFVTCVKKLIPLPPFDIEIQTDDTREICSPDFFEELDLAIVDDHSWDNEDNVSILEFSLNDSEKGFRGKAAMAFISNHSGDILESLDKCQKNVIVDGETFLLSSSISYATNCIHKSTTSLEVDEDGGISSHESFREVCKSFSRLSVHGIDVPCSLFRDYTNYGQKAVLEFPFPLRFRLDVGSTNDLNLNSARTQVIYDEVWISFKQQLTETILTKIKGSLSKAKWRKMKRIFSTISTNSSFLDILQNI